MEEGKKSLAFSMNYFDPERTLTDEEVTEAHNRVLTAVEEKFVRSYVVIRNCRIYSGNF